MRKNVIFFCAFFITPTVTAYSQSKDDVKIREVIALDNERVAALLRGDIEPLKNIYRRTLEALLTP